MRNFTESSRGRNTTNISISIQEWEKHNLSLKLSKNGKILVPIKRMNSSKVILMKSLLIVNLILLKKSLQAQAKARIRIRIRWRNSEKNRYMNLYPLLLKRVEFESVKVPVIKKKNKSHLISREMLQRKILKSVNQIPNKLGLIKRRKELLSNRNYQELNIWNSSNFIMKDWQMNIKNGLQVKFQQSLSCFGERR